MRFGPYSARFVALVLAILGGGVSLHPQAPSTLDPLLLQQQLTQPLGESRIIVTVDTTLSLDALAVFIAQAGGVPGRPLPLINGQTAIVPNASLATLALTPAVQHLALARPVEGTLRIRTVVDRSLEAKMGGDSAVQVSLDGAPAALRTRIEEYQAAGVEHLVVSFEAEDLPMILRDMQRFAAEVCSAFDRSPG